MSEHDIRIAIGLLLTVLLLTLTLAPAVALPGEKLMPPRTIDRDPLARQRIISSYLPAGSSPVDPEAMRVLDAGPANATVTMLVQFTLPMEDVDLSGFSVIYSFRFLNGATLTGSVAAFRELARDPNIFWMEYDAPMHLMMEMSTTTINASKIWDSEIPELPGRINGDGITVVVLDTGIDADHPDLDYGEKTIMNLKADAPGGPWHERRNSDTSYGHGTHCAGTIAGNGDASAGARRGVAPGAKLIGLSVGDVGITLTNVLGGLEWVYDHSRTGANPDNIRVVSNSWGGGADYYSPQDSLSQICEKLDHDNNVVCVFAAGNAGSDDHDGSELTTSPTANTPVNIAVAAFERDGGGVATFSSRGKADRNETWPDIGAPGVKIWSAHARKTEISAMQNVLGQNPNPYYLAISGTSMATPHVSGLVALLFQACPSMTLSYLREDYSGQGDYTDWFNSSYARVHEAEWILEESAAYLPANGDNGVPAYDPSTMQGHSGKPVDFAQGYGLVRADRAVGIALTLQSLRDRYPDANITVADAVDAYDSGKVLSKRMLTDDTDMVIAHLSGEYSRWNDVTQAGFQGQNQTCKMYVPAGALHLSFDMSYVPSDLTELRAGDLSYTIDIGDDGTMDVVGEFSLTMKGTKHLDMDITDGDTGKDWSLTIVGRGLKVPLSAFNPDRSYVELRIEYDASVSLTMEPSTVMDIRKESSQYLQFHFSEPSSGYSGGNVSMLCNVYEPTLGDLPTTPERAREKGSTPVLTYLLIIVLAVLAAVSVAVTIWYYLKRNRKGVQ